MSATTTQIRMYIYNVLALCGNRQKIREIEELQLELTDMLKDAQRDLLDE